MYKCVYNRLAMKCNATASVIFTTYYIIYWKPLLSTFNCTVSK